MMSIINDMESVAGSLFVHGYVDDRLGDKVDGARVDNVADQRCLLKLLKR